MTIDNERALNNMIEHTYKSPRGEVHYWKSTNTKPEQKTLVFLPGLTADHRLFDKQVPYFINDYQLIIWDAPAHGKSRPYNDFSYPNMAEDLKGILDDNKIDQVILIGQSLGGYVAQSFLMHYPENVLAFVSIDSSPYGDYYSKSDFWWLRQVEWMSKLIPFGQLKKISAKQNTTTESARLNMLAMTKQYNKNEFCHLMGIAYSKLIDDNRPLEIKCPTLLLLGEKDKTGKVKAYNKEWTKRTGFPLRIIPNAAHCSNDDNPEVVNKIIETFLKSL